LDDLASAITTIGFPSSKDDPLYIIIVCFSSLVVEGNLIVSLRLI